MAFKLKHKGAAALLKSMSSSPIQKDPTDKKNTETSGDPRYKTNKEGEQIGVIDRVGGGAFQPSKKFVEDARSGKGKVFTSGAAKPYKGYLMDSKTGKATDDPSRAYGYKNQKGEFVRFSIDSKSTRAKQLKEYQKERDAHNKKMNELKQLQQKLTDYKGPTKDVKTAGAKKVKGMGPVKKYKK